MTLAEWVNRGRLHRFVILVPFWTLLFLLMAHLIDLVEGWPFRPFLAVIALGAGTAIGLLYTFLPPVWWRSHLKKRP